MFTKFYEIETYALQTQYLASCVNKTEVKRHKKQAVSQKGFTTILRLMNFRVCKEFFLRTFDISNRRLRVICQKKSEEGFTEPDKRGSHTPSNKISTDIKNDVITHINMFPRYKSHYSRSQNNSTKYLAEDLNIKKMHCLYKEWCVERNRPSVKESYYRHVFCTEFNLKFHKPHSDTCHTCDRLNNLIKHSADVDTITKSKTELELHHRKVESVKHNKKCDIEYATQNCEKVRAICFDLQKTLPTPLLSTNKVYYLRQLWTYNFCVHDLVSGVSFMFIWNETLAQRGSQEIGSCLIKYIQSLPSTVKELICYSDQCGGQNKNKNIAKLLMFIVQSKSSLEIIHHKFFEPGHSYMECDRSFGLIEKVKKKALNIFVPDHWMELIKNSSKKFRIYNMNQNDFLSFKYLDDIMIHPKKTIEKDPIKWREIMWFEYRKENFLSFLIHITTNPQFPAVSSENCSCLKAGRPNWSIKNLKNPLYNGALKIPKAKWENLQQLLPFVPPIYHDFYQNMAHQSTKKKVTQVKQSTSKETEDGEILQEYSDGELYSDYDT
ncbi:hypothetical protein RI129_000830 [Pyrocoelia pectoralis]|uniref:Uncharacterized protein n=1 Tax=Pyrocoelia pectoralis TaxID=417401 RepID=A0AAN7VTF9_9COLE